MKNKTRKIFTPEMVFQQETAECGLACISMFAAALGQTVELPALRERFPITSAGASLDQLTDILGQLNINVLPVRFDVKQMEALPLPAILHFGGNHFVFIAERRGRYVQLFNPASGEAVYRLDTLLEHFTGYAIIPDYSSPVTAGPTGQRPRRQPLLPGVQIPFRWRIFTGSLLVGILAFLQPLLFSRVLDKGAFPQNFGLWTPFIVVTLAVVLSALLDLALVRLGIAQQRRLSRQYLPGLFNQLLQKPMAWFEQRAAADVNQRFASLARILVQRGGLLNTLWIALLTALLSTLAMFWLHPLLGSLALLVILIYGAISSWYSGPRITLHHATENLSGEYQAFTYETLNSIGLIKSAGLQHERCAKFAQKNENLLNSVTQLQWLSARQSRSYQLLASLENIAMLGVAMYLFAHQALTVGQLFAFVMFKQLALGAATRFYMAWIQVRESRVMVQRAQELLPETTPASATALTRRHFSALRCENFTFSWVPGRPVFTRSDLQLQAGEKIAVTGLSGSGKSSLLKVLCGWYQPQQGQLSLNGEHGNWADLQQLAFYQRSEDTLLQASVLDNVLLFNERGKSGEAIQLLHQLDLEACIAALPHGHRSQISHRNPLLSAGQQQRLMLARALCSDKPLLLLDEPTANLDKQAATRAIDTILDSEKTILVALHDRQLAQRFDRVIELRDGKLQVMSGDAFAAGERPV
ncbi:ATP-binding cassette domain-containing protein [Pantoea cypripedii]|uniref:peptidase domain-containing ABC transporter n=1 Tax=Pantoea cypripedii TaxID=55209 RepID=UPI002FC84D88